MHYAKNQFDFGFLTSFPGSEVQWSHLPFTHVDIMNNTVIVSSPADAKLAVHNAYFFSNELS